MDNKDNKRGFSGLSDLTSDTGTLPQSQPRQTSPQPSAPQKPVFALLELTKWPTLPAPWSSVDAGETWVWGDFFLTFQKKPKTVLDLTMEMRLLRRICGIASKRLVDNNLIKDDYSLILRAETLGSLDRPSWTV